MLVLTRKVGERSRIGTGIVVTLVRVQGDRVRLGIAAPPEVAVLRQEVRDRLQAARAKEEGPGAANGAAQNQSWNRIR